MYIVRDKATRKIIHMNPAPVYQALSGTDVYYQLDPKTMEVGRGDIADVPEHFDIDKQGLIVPWTLERQVKEGLKKLPPELKAVGNDVVPKTLAEKVADGTIKLKPTEKLVGDLIERKTGAELVAEGHVKLGPTQILDGDEVREMTEGEKAAAGLIKLAPHLKVVGKVIVSKTPADLVKDKLLTLAPDEKIEGDAIIKLNVREMLEEGRINLQQYKQAVIERHAEATLAARRKEVPDHELLYAAIGALDAASVEKGKAIVSSHLKKANDAKKAIEKAATADEADAAAGLGPWPSRGLSRVAIPQ